MYLQKLPIGPILIVATLQENGVSALKSTFESSNFSVDQNSISKAQDCTPGCRIGYIVQAYEAANYINTTTHIALTASIGVRSSHAAPRAIYSNSSATSLFSRTRGMDRGESLSDVSMTTSVIDYKNVFFASAYTVLSIDIVSGSSSCITSDYSLKYTAGTPPQEFSEYFPTNFESWSTLDAQFWSANGVPNAIGCYTKLSSLLLAPETAVLTVADFTAKIRDPHG